MSTQNQKTQRVLQLADMIVSDIRDKGLGAGDRYLSTIETARMLKVDTTDVNKAMQLLVKRHVLMRRQRLGTFVGKGLDRGHVAGLRKVRIFVSYSEVRDEGLFDSEIMMGLQESLPHVKLSVDFISREREAKELNHLIGEILRNPEPEGLILTASTLFIQRAVAASGLPAVVLGHLHPSVKGLSFVDSNPFQIGRELTNYLLGRECGRIVCVFRQHMLPGDHIMLDTVAKTLSEHGEPGFNLAVRCLPFDRAVIAAEVEHFLDTSEEPVGFLVRVAPKADLVYDTICERFEESRATAMVVSADDRYGSDGKERPYARIRPQISQKELGKLLGRMLVERAENGPAHIQSELLEMQLIYPENF
ncbi:MAG: GntR family transcriptional regulator [Pirellulales bacterium]|nr:GntR family transcriptional regulator [Pirellulales bacterium]